MIRCHFCRTEVADAEAASETGWVPYFYDGEQEISQPVCPACTSARLQLGEDGELELAEHTRYADEAESAQRGNAWPQAAALWQMAAERCHHPERRAHYERQAARCRELPGIAEPEP